jgi:hypothetical protein
MGQTHPTLFSEKDKQEILEDMRKRDPQKPIQAVKIKRIEKPYKYEPASIFTDTQQAEMNRIQNEEGGKALCSGADCEPHTLPVVNPTE